MANAGVAKEDSLSARGNSGEATPTSDVKGKLSSIVLATEQRSGVGDGCTAIDHISFLLHSLMASQGFVPDDSIKLSHSSPLNHTYSYTLPISASTKIGMVCFVMGPQLITHVQSKTIDSEGLISQQSYQAVFKIAKFTTNSGVIINKEELTRLFKDTITHRVITDVHRALGLTERGTLSSLSSELKYHVMRLLDVASVLALGATCRELHTLSLDPQLWRTLHSRDIKGVLVENGQWLKSYKKWYCTRKLLTRPATTELWEWPVHQPRPLFPHFPDILSGEYDELPMLACPTNPFHLHSKRTQTINSLINSDY